MKTKIKKVLWYIEFVLLVPVAFIGILQLGEVFMNIFPFGIFFLNLFFYRWVCTIVGVPLFFVNLIIGNRKLWWLRAPMVVIVIAGFYVAVMEVASV